MSNVPQTDPSSALATFGVIAGPRIGAEIPVPKPVVTIGQGPQNDVVIDDDSVSRTHARLDFELGGWRLTDLGSTNGTLVEGVRLAPEVPTPLDYGDTVRFGGVQVQFRAVERADPEAARAAFTPPPAKEAGAPRRFRLPLWLFLLILLVLAAVIFFALQGPPGADPTAGSVSLLLAPAPHSPAAP